MALLWTAHYRCSSAFRRMELEIGLTGLEHLALQIIEYQPGIDVAALSTLLDGDAASVSAIVRRLIKLRLVVAVRDDADGRRKHLTLTALGRIARRRSEVVPESMRR